jgi:hypothetical protein
VTWAIEEEGYSQRRACGLIGIEPKTYRYASTGDDDAALRQRLRELASLRRRFGYRRLLILLRREGHGVRPCAHAAEWALSEPTPHRLAIEHISP